MNVPPMRPWQNAIALGATVLACGALLPLAPHVRIACAGVAFAVIVGLLTARLRMHAVRRGAARASGVYDRIERMRAERGERRR
jgi:hypothetical protein